MRKVTASAVILTALTGCSQNSVPSTQWSFEVPNGNQAVGFQRTTNDSTSSSFASEISASALTDSLQSQTGAMMGPAFEQPGVSSAKGTRSQTPSAADALASGDLSSLVTTATNPRSNAFIQATVNRPDPIAQARSYLSRSSRPTAVISRVPYTSQVYLPSTPAAAPLSALGTVPAAPVVPPVISPQATPQLTAQTPTQPAIQSTSVAARPIASSATATTSIPDVVRPDSIPSLYQEATVSDSSLSTNVGALPDSERSASTTAANAPVIDRGLPILRPNENIASQRPVDSPIASQPPVTAEENVPIGTSILQELQRDGINANTEPAPSVAAQTTAAQTQTQSAALAATAQAEDSPTLARLLAGLPVREQAAPSITSFRQPAESLPTGRALDNQIADNQIAENQNTEVQNIEGQTAYGSNGNLLPSSEPSETHSPEHSPLLSGLDSTETVASTIYVPIPESTAVDTSASFIQAAIAALEKEASAIAFNLESSENQGILSLETLELLQQETDAPKADTQATELQDIEFQGRELRDADRLARLLSLIRTSHRMPSLVQDTITLPTEASSDENLQAIVISEIQTDNIQTTKHSRDPVTTAPAKQSVRKYRQRISWKDSAI